MRTDEDYYNKPIEANSGYSQCLIDVENGVLKIYDIPLKYRSRTAYILARKALRYKMFGNERSVTEKELLAKTLKDDIMKYKEVHLDEKMEDLLSIYCLCIEDEYIHLSENEIEVYLTQGVKKMLEI